MAKGDLPGAFEQLVLLSVLRLGDNAYGMTVRRDIEERTERGASLGAVYATLERLESKGYLSSLAGGAVPEREGRARRYFRITADGHAAASQALRATDRMRAGLPGLEPLAGGAA